MARTITVQRTRIPVDNIAWLIRSGLTRREQVYLLLLCVSAVTFLGILYLTKGRWLTLESLLSLFPLWVASTVHGKRRLAFTGDSAATYGSRRVPRSHELTQELENDGFLHLESPHRNYDYLINLSRIQYVRPWHHVNMAPLRLCLVFGIYAFLVWARPPVPDWPVLRDLAFLTFDPQWIDALFAISAAIAGLGLATLVATARRGLKIGCQGGVAEDLLLYRGDRQKLLQSLDATWADEPDELEQHRRRLVWPPRAAEVAL